MQRLLIAESSQLFAGILEKRLRDQMEVRVCYDGQAALELLQSFRPDALVLNLQLPMKDGLTVLRQSHFVPPVVLAIAAFTSPYIQRTAYALGVSQMVLMPTANSLSITLTDLLQRANDPDRVPDLREQARMQLEILNIQPHLNGYKQLAVILPLIAADPEMPLEWQYKEVEKILKKDWRSVEKSIRKAIEDAWDARDPAAWEKIFPGQTECPNNKRFFARVTVKMTK